MDFVEEDGIKYTKGDFVYVKRNDDDDKLEPHVMRIVRLWRDGSSRENFVSGNWFYRPHETFHLARRKFLDQVIFFHRFFFSSSFGFFCPNFSFGCFFYFRNFFVPISTIASTSNDWPANVTFYSLEITLNLNLQ